MDHLKSLESQFRFVCPHFSSINSNCALRYTVFNHASSNGVEIIRLGN